MKLQTGRSALQNLSPPIHKLQITEEQGQKVFWSHAKPSETQVVHYNLRKSGDTEIPTQTHPTADLELRSSPSQVLT